MVQIYDSKGIAHNPLFRNRLGNQARAGDFEDIFFERLDCVKEEHPELMTSIEDVIEEYGVFRSFWQKVDLEAVNEGASLDVIDTTKQVEKNESSWC